MARGREDERIGVGEVADDTNHLSVNCTISLSLGICIGDPCAPQNIANYLR
jgi:hypothetical protein